MLKFSSKLTSRIYFSAKSTGRIPCQSASGFLFKRNFADGTSNSSVQDSIDKMIARSIEEQNDKKKKARKNLEKFRNSLSKTRRSVLNSAVKNTKFFPGQSYLPEDLVGSGSAQKVYPPARPSYQIIIPKEEPDFLDKNGISIETQYKNVALLSENVNDLGQVYGMRKTGLSKFNQRRLVRTLRKAICFGIIPRNRKHWGSLRFHG